MRSHLLTTAASLLTFTSAASLEEALQQHESLSSIHGILKQLDYFKDVEEHKDVTFLALTNNAISYLTKFGIDLTKIDPFLAKGILDYHLLEGVHTTSTLAKTADSTIVHSVLKPPILTNVTAGPMVKFLPQAGGSAVVVESGLQSLTPLIESDIEFDSGVVHAVDFNLVLPHNLSETLTVGGLTGFLDLIHQSELLDDLDWLVDATYFFPSDDAIAREARALASASNEQLKNIVASHAVPNKVLASASLRRSTEYKTQSGKSVTIKRDAHDDIHVDGIKVQKADVLMYGGIAHIINGVISSGKIYCAVPLIDPKLTCHNRRPPRERPEHPNYQFAITFEVPIVRLEGNSELLGLLLGSRWSARDPLHAHCEMANRTCPLQILWLEFRQSHASDMMGSNRLRTTLCHGQWMPGLAGSD